MAEQTKFAARYGPWAIVAGASEGLGAAYAEELAARDLKLVLIARRQKLLQAVASRLSTKYGVETKVCASNALARTWRNRPDVLFERVPGLSIYLHLCRDQGVQYRSSRGVMGGMA